MVHSAEDGPARTACYEEHVRLGARLVDFHGFELPIQYAGITAEHKATRTTAGLFDVSHMGFFLISGKNALRWLERLATQNVLAIEAGRCAYTHFLDHHGRIIDDMIFAVTNREEILNTGFMAQKATSEVSVFGVPNASMINVMWSWFQTHLPNDGSVHIENLSSGTSILALQGPNSATILSRVLGDENVVAPFRAQSIKANDLEVKGWIQGTGYTGERGFEIMIQNNQAPILWRALMEDGAVDGLHPVGLGARDTLRLEKGYLLSGQDFVWPELAIEYKGMVPAEQLGISTWQANIPFGLDLGHEFIGRDALLADRDANARRLWGLKAIERGAPPRAGHAIRSLDGENEIGIVTSGAPAPSLNSTGIALALLDHAEIGDRVQIVSSPRRPVVAEVVSPPFL